MGVGVEDVEYYSWVYAKPWLNVLPACKPRAVSEYTRTPSPIGRLAISAEGGGIDQQPEPPLLPVNTSVAFNVQHVYVFECVRIPMNYGERWLE